MTVTKTVQKHLSDAGIDFDLIPHDHTGSSMSTAMAAHISSESMAKAVLLKDGAGYLMAIMPATYKLSENEMYDVVGRRMQLAKEDELNGMFPDCDAGAVPPLAAAYGLEAVWDDSLSYLKDVYFESGDHDNVVHVTGKNFRKLMGNAPHAHFSHHM